MNAGAHHLTAFFKQAVTTKQPASMQIVSSCDNATHVVQPKHTH